MWPVRQSAQPVFPAAAPVLQLLISLSVFSGGLCQNVVLTCPVLPTMVVGNVTCALNSANLTALSCAPSSVFFHFQRPPEQLRTLCSVSYSGTCGQKPAGELACGCVNSAANISSYQLNLPADKTVYDRGILTCSINCLPVETFSTTCTLQYEKPNGILSHTCPQYVKEGNNLSCECFANDTGSPQEKLKWANMTSSQLFLTALQREQNGETYQCDLTWNKTTIQSLTYQLVIAYQPTQMNFTLNSSNKNLTVPENSTVTMLCQSDGRPRPAMTLTGVTNDNVLNSLPEGNVTVDDQRGELRHTLQAVSCQTSGQYKCSADNSVGRKEQSVTLFVKCAPRLNEATSPAYGTGYIPTVTYNNKETQISFQVTAYPTPQMLNKMFLGSCNCSSIKTEARDGLIQVSCGQSGQSLSSFICTIIVDNVLPRDAGFYEVVIGNSLGQISLTFEVKVGNDEGSQSESAKGYDQGFAAGLGTGVGVTVAVDVVLLVTAVLWAWRRNWSLPCRHVKNAKGARSGISAEDNEGPSSSLESSGNTYDALYTKEVGAKSPYASLNVPSKGKGETAVKSISPRIRNVQTEEPYSSIN